MRILIVTDGLQPSLHATAVGLADRGHHVRVIGAAAGELNAHAAQRLDGRIALLGDAAPEGALRALRTDRTGVRLAVERARDGRSWSAAKDELRALLPALEWAADVVHIEAANVALRYGAILDRLGPKEITCTGSDLRILPEESPWMAAALPGVFARTARIVCVSADLARYAAHLGAPAPRTTVLPPAVDTAFFHPVERPPRGDGVLRVVSVGRLHWVKAYEDALRAVALLRDRGVPVRYAIVAADSGSRAAVEHSIRDLDLEGIVTLVGRKTQEGIRAALARADVFLSSSVSEGISRSMLEAMAMGLPVVVTDVGGTREAVDDGVEGYLVPSRRPDALADALERVACEQGITMEMRRCARARSLQFDATSHLDAMERIMEDIAAAG